MSANHDAGAATDAGIDKVPRWLCKIAKWTGHPELFVWEKPTRFDKFLGVLFTAMIAAFAVLTWCSSNNLKLSLFWFGGMILSCESLLSFYDVQGKKSAIFAFVFRTITYVAAFFALGL